MPRPANVHEHEVGSGTEEGDALPTKEWPPWWSWDLELTSHLLKRMSDRRFTEAEVRDMFNHATGLVKDIVEGRWVIQSRLGRVRWELIVEPDAAQRLLVVITAYRPEVD